MGKKSWETTERTQVRFWEWRGLNCYIYENIESRKIL